MKQPKIIVAGLGPGNKEDITPGRAYGFARSGRSGRI